MGIPEILNLYVICSLKFQLLPMVIVTRKATILQEVCLGTGITTSQKEVHIEFTKIKNRKKK